MPKASGFSERTLRTGMPVLELDGRSGGVDVPSQPGYTQGHQTGTFPEWDSKRH